MAVDHVSLARLLLSVLCTVQAVATVAIDLNRTHATNPVWPGHARFHLVWQSATVVLLSLVELVLLWSKQTFGATGFYLACLLAMLSPMGFMTALVCRRRYKGKLSDRHGVPPGKVTLAGEVRTVDMNVVAVLFAFLAMAAILTIYRA